MVLFSSPRDLIVPRIHGIASPFSCRASRAVEGTNNIARVFIQHYDLDIYKVLKPNCRLVYRAKPSHRKPYAHILRDPARTWKRWLYELRDFLLSDLDHTTPNAATLISSRSKLMGLCPKRVVRG